MNMGNLVKYFPPQYIRRLLIATKIQLLNNSETRRTLTPLTLNQKILSLAFPQHMGQGRTCRDSSRQCMSKKVRLKTACLKNLHQFHRNQLLNRKRLPIVNQYLSIFRYL